MRTKIQKWGNSLALRLPKPLADGIQVDRNSEVDIALVDGQLLITPVPDRNQQLARLLDEITDENLHGEVDMGSATGREIW